MTESKPPILTDDQVRQWIATNLSPEDFRDKRLLLVVPDATRTAPMPLLFDALFKHLRSVVASFDVMIALGTHPPMSEAQICKLLGISEKERPRLFYQTEFINHEWDNPDALLTLGTLSKKDTEAVSNGLLSMEVPVQINKRITDYDRLLVVGPVFPHEVVGFSGGNKYFFPGIAGPELLPGSRILHVIESGELSHDTMTKDVGRVRVYGDVAVVTGRGRNTGHFRGQRMSADEWVTDVYRKVDGRWLCVLTHLTPVAAR